ncbi:ATP-binding protein [Kitasatospora aureofaciens]|uniref:ATP-binding protein n=1 Tax=Kitasatospora aureofaciens TaxID=1894 RepID=UPI001C445327|nr:ATP-binding protein [Kitasatospora aureofaciens]MBV6698459.1 ATP-binding protein [Kitasatospora aureofaciens]
MRNLNSPSLTIARETLRDAMTRAGWGPSAIADAELALAELIVNAWRHGDTTSPVVNILFLHDTLRVAVADRSSTLPEPCNPSALSETGRGLQLVDGLTHRWGVDPQKLGKAVWFELELDGAA